MPRKKKTGKQPPTPEKSAGSTQRKLDLAEQLYDTADAIALLKCSINTLYNLRRDKMLPYIIMRGKIFYLEEDLVEMLQRFRRLGVPSRKRFLKEDGKNIQ